MKLKLFFFMLCVSLMLNAQQDSILLRQYETKIEENVQLKQRVKKLEKDSISLSKKINALQTDTANLNIKIKQNEKSKKENKKLEARISRMMSDSAKQSKTIDDLKRDTMRLHSRVSQVDLLEDSIVKLKGELQTVSVTMKSFNDTIIACKGKLQQQESLLNKNKRLPKYVTDYFKNRNTAALYEMSKIDYLTFCIALYGNMNIAMPKSMQEALLLYNAEIVLKQKYSKTEVDKQINLVMPIIGSSISAKSVCDRLYGYQKINAEAASLWDRIAVRVEENRNNGFNCLNIQRQIWQAIQDFINAHPNIQNDYPYIYDNLQNFLAESWKVEDDDVKKILKLTKPNPFK